MYEEITCTNDPSLGGIRIEVQMITASMPTYVSVQLRRCVTGTTEYTILYEHAVESAEDLSYSYDDLGVVAGISYTYEACGINENGLRILDDTGSATCQFEGIVLADETASWHSAFGTSESQYSFSAAKNKPTNYIVTLSGKYPHRVSNSQANYWTGACSALWLPKGEDCGEPTVENALAYRQAFVEWLLSDTEKLMKTGDGKAMLVAVDNPREEYNGVPELTTVSFDWTQIGEVETPVQTVNVGAGWKGV